MRFIEISLKIEHCFLLKYPNVIFLKKKNKKKRELHCKKNLNTNNIFSLVIYLHIFTMEIQVIAIKISYKKVQYSRTRL